MYIKTKLIDTQRTDWWLPKAGGEWYRNNGTAFFLWKFKCSERNPKSPTVTVAVLLPNTLRNLGMRAPAAPRPCPHTHTHTHTHASCSLSPHVCRHSSQRALHGGLLHSPSPWLASHLTLPLGKPLLMEASSDPSVRPAPLSRSYSLWPLSLAVPLSVQTSAITHSIAVNTRLLPWTGFQKGRQSISWFLTAVFPALVPTCNFWRENMAGGKPVCELRKFKVKARVLTRGHLSSLTLPCWCEGDQRTKTPWAP